MNPAHCPHRLGRTGGNGMIAGIHVDRDDFPGMFSFQPRLKLSFINFKAAAGNLIERLPILIAPLQRGVRQ